MLTSLSANAACDSGCDTTVTVYAGTARRTGSTAVAAEIHLDVSTKLTSADKGVGGVRIAFNGILPDGRVVDAAGAVTNADGIAHYSGLADYEPANALTSVATARTLSYSAQAVVAGSARDSSVCNLLDARSEPAALWYAP